MNGEQKNQQTERQPLPQKVGWMPKTFPEVNSTEYWAFRRAHENMTHHNFTVYTAKKELDTTDRNKIVEYLVNRWVTAEFADDNTERQIRQFLSQLTARGWNRLINAIVTAVSMK